MPLTLEQYADEYLPTRGLPWPAAPKVDPPKAKPHLERLPVKAVMWTVYGTLLDVPGGELQFEHPTEFVMAAALDKVIQEFKMWQSMSRKPGAPAEYMRELYTKALTNLRMTGGGGEKHPEVASERIWDDIVKKLQQKEYTFDAGTYGPQPEFVKKIAYFFHASIQGCAAYPGAAVAVRLVSECGRQNGFLADGQCFTPAQVHMAFRQQDPAFYVNSFCPPPFLSLSGDKKAKKPSDTLFKAAVDALKAKGIAPHEAVHVGSNLDRDVLPAKKHGFRTALFAGDKTSLVATKDRVRDPASRPDVMLTELTQIVEVMS